MDEPSPQPSDASPIDTETNGELFLSYNSQDREPVRQVREVLRARGVGVFLDREELIVGRPWPDALERALRSSSAVAVFYGANGLSGWQKREMSYALDRQVDAEANRQEFSVIPVLLPGADLESAPAFLLLNTWVDLRAGMTDGPEFDAIVRALRGSAQSAPRPAQVSVLCPYRALRAFREEDASLFFGREVFASELLKKVRSQQLVAVVGPSGSGKSSVVQAGLLPLLRRERPPRPTWDSVVSTPGKRPFHNLAAALVEIWAAERDVTDRLAESNKLGDLLSNHEVPAEVSFAQALKASKGSDTLLVIIDQFEELFTLTAQPDRKGFIESIIKASNNSSVKIVLTLRADFYGQALSLSRELSDLLQNGLVNLGPMRPEELRRAIEEPAKTVTLDFEPGLVERILEHIESQPGSLPLLEFALTELWEGRRGNNLTHNQYRAIGEITGAISNRAEEQFGLLTTDQQQALLRVMTRLVRVAAASEEGSDTRQRLVITELDPEQRRAVQSFADARLLVTSRNASTGEETLEVAHESLIRDWRRLREQLDRDRDFLIWSQRLAPFLTEWELSGRVDEPLLSAPLLLDAPRWMKERQKELTPREREFIRKSLRREHQGRLARKLAVAAVIALILISAGAAIAWRFWIRSLDYQVKSVMNEAPPFVKIVCDSNVPDASYDWIHTLVLANKIDDAREAVEHSFTYSSARKGAGYAELSTALMEIGRKDQAVEAARQAVKSGGDSGHFLTEAGSRVVATLKKVGLDKEAEETATKISEYAQKLEQGHRFSELATAAESLAKIGKHDEAKRVVETGLEEMRAAKLIYLDDFTMKMAQVLVATGDKAAASRVIDEQVKNQTTSTSPNLWTRRQVLSKVVGLMVKADRYDEALARVRTETEAEYRVPQLILIAEELVDEKRTREAAAVAREVQESAYSVPPYRVQETLLSVAEIMFDAGAEDDAKRLVQEIVGPDNLQYSLDANLLNRTANLMLNLGMSDAARPLADRAMKVISESSSDQQRSRAFADLTMNLVRMREYQSARIAAGSCSASEEKLRAYTSILNQYVKERYPQFAQLLLRQELAWRKRRREATY